MLTQMRDPIVEDQSPLGEFVQDAEGQPIGRITNVLFDPDTGEVTHVLVSLDGILGLESKEVAVRREALAPSPSLTDRDEVGPYSINLDREHMRFPETATLLLI
jgi:sporulation protein YlmC with PRC-barrel domain